MTVLQVEKIPHSAAVVVSTYDIEHPYRTAVTYYGYSKQDALGQFILDHNLEEVNCVLLGV